MYGYYPTRQLVLQTALGIEAMKRNGQVGQGLHSICLSGPPGAGKSFFTKTYKKVLEKILNKKIDIVKYTCNTSTGKADLYEEINITEAVVDDKDRDKIILPGKVLKAIDLVNEGKNVLLFLDEYDKAREETDTFLLDFLQDGEINTTQRGTATIKEEYLKNLQVIVCKNDHREELSGPLTRRLKFLELDYMKPDILCKAINYSLKDSNQSIKDSIVLLYTAIYEQKDNFSRIPACSECMQAIKDAEDLMNMGANKLDIITTAIIANMFKNENDVETFRELVRRKDELIEWYDCILDAVGRNDQGYMDRLKTEMARSFYPEQLKIVTKELEERRSELETQRKIMEKETREYTARKTEMDKETAKLKEKEEELVKREEETKKLRESAQQDAIQTAQEIFDEKSEKMQKEYQEKEKELEEREEETRKLRENAQEDALEFANKKIEEEREKIEKIFEEKAKELDKEVKEKIDAANEQIRQINKEIQEKLTNHNYIQAKKEEVEKLLKEKEQTLKKQKELLEKLLGRQLEDSDLDVLKDDEEQELGVDKNKNFVVQNEQKGEIQKIDENSSDSVFDVSSNGNWTEIGEIVLEKSDNPEKFKFNQECSKKLGKILTGEKYKKQRTAVHNDGIALYQGLNNKVIAVRIIEQEGNQYKNLYRFYSNMMVTPIQAFQMIVNTVGNINACGINIVSKDTIEMKLNCLLYSDRQHITSQNCKYEELDDEVYYLKYENKTEKNPVLIAKFLISKEGLNCSVKETSEEKLELIDKKAFISHSEIINGEKMEVIEKIKEISESKLDKIENVEEL